MHVFRRAPTVVGMVVGASVVGMTRWLFSRGVRRGGELKGYRYSGFGLNASADVKLFGRKDEV